MSAMTNKCPKCGSTELTLVKNHNPDTSRFNCDVDFQCKSCEHTFKGQVTSEHHKMMRREGFAI